MKIQSVITHRKQQLPYSCGAASIAMLFGADEKLIREEVRTKSSGTNYGNVCGFLNRLGIKHHWKTIEKNYYEVAPHLIQTSYQYPIYIGATYKSRYFERGRDQKRVHASLFADGLIYDPAESREMCWEVYEKVFNKELIYNSFILIEEERPNYLRNFRKFLEENG